MSRSARRHRQEPQGGALRAGAAVAGSFVAANPVLVGGATAFLVAMSFVSANALWYQPHAHPGAFFKTRSVDAAAFRRSEADTTIHIEREPETPAETAAAPPQRGDPTTARVQEILKELSLYGGSVDGIAGPATRRAIGSYQEAMGLEVTGSVDQALLDMLGAEQTTAAIAPVPVPRTTNVPAPPAKATAADTDRITRIQAGLKAFGNEGIEVDGKIGSRTRSALREFQALFGLPETGEPDDIVYAKMREIGLTN